MVSLIGLIGLVNALLAVAIWFAPRVTNAVPTAAIMPDSGKAYLAEVHFDVGPFYTVPSDNLTTATASRLILLEDARPLGPAHSSHNDIRLTGAGRFSHWGDWIYFSSSDGSDPRSGRHVYTIESSTALHRLSLVPFIVFDLVILIVLWRQLTALTAWLRALGNRLCIGVSQALVWYAICTGACLGVADFIYGSSAFTPVQPAPVGNLTDRAAWYRGHTADYNLVFLGDSRTYCAMHPELIDPLLNTSSFNLASFANWFPTQLALVQDLAPIIPKGTTVVWSLGWQNFTFSTGIHHVYPIGFRNAVRYLAWGVPTKGMADNLIYFNPALRFLATRGAVRQDFLDFLNRPFDWATLSGITQTEAAESLPLPSSELLEKTTLDARDLAQIYRDLPNVHSVDLNRDGDKITSLTVHFRRGSYYRIEVDHSFFRQKQTERGPTVRGDQPIIEPPYWHIFEQILSIFKANGVDIIVNEIDEAPFVYSGGLEQRRRYHKYMRGVVAKRVQEAGFPYVSVDFERLTDEDYFDYDHINSRGARTFIPMLVQKIRPYVQAYPIKTLSGPSSE